MLWNIRDYKDVVVSRSWKRSIAKYFAFDKKWIVFNKYIFKESFTRNVEKKLCIFIDYLAEIHVKYNSWWSSFFIYQDYLKQFLLNVPFWSPRKRQKTIGLLSYVFKKYQKGISESNGLKKLYLKSLAIRTTEKYPFVWDMFIHTILTVASQLKLKALIIAFLYCAKDGNGKLDRVQISYMHFEFWNINTLTNCAWETEITLFQFPLFSCYNFDQWNEHKQPPGRCSMKKTVLKNIAIFTGRYLCWSLFLTHSRQNQPT